MKAIATVLTLLLTYGILPAQSSPAQHNCQKIGYADANLILSKMPEFNRIQNDLQLDMEQYQKQFNAKVEEYESKLKAYQQGGSALIEVVRLDKEAELRRIQESIQKFQEDAQVSLRKKEANLLAPVFDRVGRAIEEVASEQEYSFVLNAGNGMSEIVRFADPMFNITELVMEKLGLQTR